MAENPHSRELLQLLNEFQVEYLIVGGFRSHEVVTTQRHESRCLRKCLRG